MDRASQGFKETWPGGGWLYQNGYGPLTNIHGVNEMPLKS